MSAYLEGANQKVKPFGTCIKPLWSLSVEKEQMHAECHSSGDVFRFFLLLLFLLFLLGLFLLLLLRLRILGLLFFLLFLLFLLLLLLALLSTKAESANRPQP